MKKRSAPVDITPLFRLEDPLHEAIQWVEQNQAVWAQMIRWAHEMRDECGYCSIQAMFEALRIPSIAKTLGLTPFGEEYKLPHSLRPQLARLMLREYPYLPFKTRKSQYDE